MSDLDKYRAEAESYGGEQLSSFAVWLSDRKKALTALAGSGVAFATQFLGADSPVVLGVVAVLTVVGVYAVPNKQ